MHNLRTGFPTVKFRLLYIKYNMYLIVTRFIWYLSTNDPEFFHTIYDPLNEIMFKMIFLCRNNISTIMLLDCRTTSHTFLLTNHKTSAVLLCYDIVIFIRLYTYSGFQVTGLSQNMLFLILDPMVIFFQIFGLVKRRN